MRRSLRILAVTLLSAGWLLPAPAALAQASPPSAAPTKPSQSIPNDKLDKAAAATVQVATLSRDYREQLAVAPPAEKQRIVDEASAKIEKAIVDQGLSVQEYSAIMDEARSNPEVHRQIVDRLPKPGN